MKRWQMMVPVLYTVLALGELQAEPPAADPAAGKSKKAAGPPVSLDVVAEGERIHLLTLAAADAGVSGLVYLHSDDAGASWSVPVRVDAGLPPPHAPARGKDAQLAVAGDRLLAMWTTTGSGFMGRGPLVTAMSEDGGRTWHAGGNPSDDGTDSGHAFQDARATEDGWEAVWLDKREEIAGLRYARWGGNPGAWSPQVTIDAETCECCWNVLARGSEGERFVLYRDKNPRDMALGVSADGGKTWERRATVGRFQWEFPGCPHVGGALAVAPKPAGRIAALVTTGQQGQVGVHVLVSENGGRTWPAAARLGDVTASHGDLAVAADGALIAVWDELIGERIGIRAAHSTDGGRTWTAPVTQNDPAVAATHPRAVWTRLGFRVFWTEGTAWKMGDVVP